MPFWAVVALALPGLAGCSNQALDLMDCLEMNERKWGPLQRWSYGFLKKNYGSMGLQTVRLTNSR